MYGKSDYILKKVPDASAFLTLTVYSQQEEHFYLPSTIFFFLFNYCNNFPSCWTSHQNIKGAEKPGIYKITELFMETCIA